MTQLRRPDPPIIEPLTDRTPRPLWSVMIPTYNPPIDYFRNALQSVLDQDPGSEDMQIEVVDNCSDTDAAEQVVQEVGNGRIGFFRQPANIGAVANFNTCIQRARGQWVHVLPADDAVLPEFYKRAAVAAAQPRAGAIAARTVMVDENGNWIGLSELERATPGLLGRDFAERLLVVQRLQCAGVIVRRSTYERVGGFLPDLPHCADWDLWKRIAIKYPIYYDPKPLSCYRLHRGSLTNGMMRRGQNVVDERRSIEITYRSLTREDGARVRRNSSRAIAIKAIRTAKTLWAVHEYAIALRQISQAARTSLAPVVIAHLAELAAWITFRSMTVASRRNVEIERDAVAEAVDRSIEAADRA